MSKAASTKAIRNFCIIAHIDHGKSTLADRILEITGAIPPRQMTKQVLDQMELEREKGITIKAKAVSLEYNALDNNTYKLNLIDTPGHVDFSYEVSRSLAACEGALLVVDSAQGVEAQTLANFNLALDAGLTIIPVLNKIDLPNAKPTVVAGQLEELGFTRDEMIFVSAKTGEGVQQVLEAIVKRIPAPPGDEASPLRALVFDSHYDPYKGVITYIRVMEGTISKGMKIKLMESGKVFEVIDVGVFKPAMTSVDELRAGEVGFVAAGIKDVRDCRIGDTITSEARPAETALPGYRKVVPMVYCGLYPVESGDYSALRDALDKLSLNDASLTYEPESSGALGHGFRCGFLGLLHLDITKERLQREYGMDLICTAPNVVYKVTLASGEVVTVENPAMMPSMDKIEFVEEPYVEATIVSPAQFIGDIMDICKERRGQFLGMDYVDKERVIMRYDLPLGSIMYDFFDQLKSRTRGYGSLDYKFKGYRRSDMVRVDVLVNNEIVDSLSVVVHKDDAMRVGRQLVEELRKLIPRHLFEIPIQAAIGRKIIARETIKPLRKDVLAKCYGGDVTRKRKLLEKQKEGKRKLKQVGRVEIPQDAFMAVLRLK